MSDYAAQFQRSYNYPPAALYPPTIQPSYPAGYLHNPSADPYRQQQQQQQYPGRFDYHPVRMQRQQHTDETGYPVSQRRVAGDIHRQWNYSLSPGYYPDIEMHRKPTDPLPPVPPHLQGFSSADSKKSYRYQGNPDTSYPRYNPVQRSKSLAVVRPKITSPYKRERSTTPPHGKPMSRSQTEDWGRISELDLPKSLFATQPVHAKQTPALADILVQSAPERKEYAHQPPYTSSLRRSSDDILNSAKYIREDQAIDSYVSLTGTRKKSKARRVSDPFSGLLPGKSLSADQLDSHSDHGLRSREESIEQLRGSHNGGESAFTANLEPAKIPTPTSSEEELRKITDVKRSKSMTTGSYLGNSENSLPKHGKIRIIANNFSKSLDSNLESGRVAASTEEHQLTEGKRQTGFVSKYQELSPNTALAYVPTDARLEEKLVREQRYEAARKPLARSATFNVQNKHALRPQPSTADPAAIRKALINELKSAQFSLNIRTDDPAKEATYSKVKKTAIPSNKEKAAEKRSETDLATPSKVGKGIEAAKSGDLETLKSHLLAEHIANPKFIDRRTSVYRTFHSYVDGATQSNLIHVTSEYGHPNCLKWLVLFAPEGACVALNKDRLVPAILAIRRGSLKCVKILVLQAKVPITIVELGSETLLHHAAFTGQAGILKWLLEHLKERQDGSLPDSQLQDVFGVTPAHFAAQQGYLDCLQLLHDAMYDVLAPDHHDQTPLDWATASGQDMTTSYLFMVKSLRYITEQLTMEKKLNLILGEKAANVESAYAQFKAEFEEQIGLVREEYEARIVEMKEAFVSINGNIIKESKASKSKRRGVFRTFSMPAKQRSAKKVFAKPESGGESSPEEPRVDAKSFPGQSVETEILLSQDVPSDANGEMLSTIDEASTLTGQTTQEATLPAVTEPRIEVIHEHREVVFQNRSAATKPEISPATDRDVSANDEFEFVPTLQKLKGENGSNYRRGSPDPFSSQELASTPDTSLQRKKRNIFGHKSGSKSSSKASLREETASRKSADSSLPRVEETTGCGLNVVTTLRRIFSGSQRGDPTVHQNTFVVTPTDVQPPQKDQVTLETLQAPVSEIEVERDFIAESECSSHHSIPPPNRPVRTAPDPPNFSQGYGRKMSYVSATSPEEVPAGHGDPYPPSYSQYPYNPFALVNLATNPQQFARVRRIHSSQLTQQSTAEQQAYPGRPIDPSDPPDGVRPRSNQSTRTPYTYSAPNPQAYFSYAEQSAQARGVSWPHTTDQSPQRSATIHLQNPRQHADASRRQFAAKKSTTISDL